MEMLNWLALECANVLISVVNNSSTEICSYLQDQRTPFSGGETEALMRLKEALKDKVVHFI